jgi:glycyl-tRNA synthetase beta chain
MRWGNNDFSFIRPVHWIVLMENEAVIPFNMFGIDSDNKSRGHRFHAPDFIKIKSAETYVKQLLKVRVEVDQLTRKQNVKDQVIKLARTNNAQARTDDDLLDEVTAIVEYPVATLGNFNEDFLKVPAEALISSMQKHQKYFPVFDKDNHLMPHFIALANIESKDVAQVIKGFEKVITPRLADARFFWEQDQKETLQSKFKVLEKMTFEKRLGSLGNKCRRIDSLMKFLAEKMNLDLLQATRAALLCKCDLITDMVNEFPDLQGIMGGYYASEQGEHENVANALSNQYKPSYSGDSIPDQPLAQALSLADKLDTLCGIFAVGKKPTGNKDPFALRRASIGIIRILQEGKLPVSIYELIELAVNQIKLENFDSQDCIKEVEIFVEQRLKHNYLEQDISFDVVDSVLANKPTNLADCDQRIIACQTFKSDSAAPALAAANKRISNILKKSIEIIPESVNLRLLKIDQEKNLYGAIESIKRRFNQEVQEHKYQAAFKHLASLAEPVDAFFDNVMVNDPVEETRLNRLAILQQLNIMFSAIADISKLEI